jgi:hypothetical protein
MLKQNTQTASSFIFAVSMVGVIAMTAILSDYAGSIQFKIGPTGVQLQIKGDAHSK